MRVSRRLFFKCFAILVTCFCYAISYSSISTGAEEKCFDKYLSADQLIRRQLETIDVASYPFSYTFVGFLVHNGAVLDFQGGPSIKLIEKLASEYEIVSPERKKYGGEWNTLQMITSIAFENASQHGRIQNQGRAPIEWGVELNENLELSIFIRNQIFSSFPEKLLHYKSGPIPSIQLRDRDVYRGGSGRGVNSLESKRKQTGAKLSWEVDNDKNYVTFRVKVQIQKIDLEQ